MACGLQLEPGLTDLQYSDYWGSSLLEVICSICSVASWSALGNAVESAELFSSSVGLLSAIVLMFLSVSQRRREAGA